ncbi:RimJ/RimL family protein N-acetyltransferase [Oryzihumus leptocrescens]|uniref:RimJ/RimL family protein N-acetyltransferase n=2 Tax=Oryzihumus leptocrescens TaxID=297536 RepID=A0A542Z9S1_9MICO|nr:RimJ/RimL family protein N-acetyltransferase [Oryzihumus leptocrescens]
MRLSSERLMLREFRAADARDVHAYASDPEVVRYTDWGPSNLAQTQERVVAKAARGVEGDDAYSWAVTIRGEDRVIGSAEVRIASRDHRRAEFGYVFAREVWGRGLATETALLLRDTAFGSFGVHRLYATCHPDNAASVRVLEKAGLQLEGRLRDHLWVRDAWRDSLLFAAVSSGPSGIRAFDVSAGQ